MAEQEARTEKYGLTQSAIEHLIGDGSDWKKDQLVDINVVGDNPQVSRLMFELMAASNQAHWHGTVTVPENADINTKLWATVKMSPDMWTLAQKLLDTHNLPNIANQKLVDKFGAPDLASGRPTKG